MVAERPCFCPCRRQSPRHIPTVTSGGQWILTTPAARPAFWGGVNLAGGHSFCPIGEPVAPMSVVGGPCFRSMCIQSSSLLTPRAEFTLWCRVLAKKVGRKKCPPTVGGHFFRPTFLARKRHQNHIPRTMKIEGCCEHPWGGWAGGIGCRKTLVGHRAVIFSDCGNIRSQVSDP